MRPRTELEKSYSAWLLYADLIIRIGYECTRWNNRCSIIEKYMFKPWMKKHSFCCQKLVGWLKERVNRQPENEASGEDEIDENEIDDDNKLDASIL
jgi:hypothetical protein